MTIKRINSTGRKRIMRQDVKVYITEAPEFGFLSFNATVDLSGYDLPNNGTVFIEAYRQSTLMRFPFGTVADPRPSEPPELKEFRQPEGLLFRVKVIDSTALVGKLLAEGEIPVSNDKEHPEDRIPLLPPRAENLGAELWRLDFTNSPELLVNERLPDWKSFVQTQLFRSLVFPAAIRQVYERIFWQRESPDTDDESSWAYQWIRFAELLPGVERHPPIDDENEMEWTDWINTVCERFAQQHNLLDAIQDEPVGEN